MPGMIIRTQAPRTGWAKSNDNASGFVQPISTSQVRKMKVDYESYKFLRIMRPAPHILEIVMSNPGKLNALDRQGHAELAEIWRDVDADPDVSCALLRGEGGNYSAGGDLGLIEEMAADWNVRIRAWREARDIVYNVINCSKPIVAAIEGPAVGAGLSAAMVSDIVIVGRTARIIDGHTRLGVAAGDHSAIVWPLLCGMAKAKYYLLLCETVTGEEAERIGLASICVDDDKVIEVARGVCERLVRLSPTAVRWTKYALNNWLRAAGPTFDASLALEFMGFSGPDIGEGVAALRDKRRPGFKPQSPY
jgi:enoyl-CoA hydratase